MRRALRILGIALPLALAITAVVVLPGWLPILPRSVQRGLTEGLLQGTLFFYAALVVAGLVGTPWFGRRTIRAWREAPGDQVRTALFALPVVPGLPLGS